MTTPHNWLGGTVLAAIILAGTAQFSGPSDIATEQAQAEYLADAQRAAAVAALTYPSTEAVARTACADLYGPHHTVFQSPEGDWVCRKSTPVSTRPLFASNS